MKNPLLIRLVPWIAVAIVALILSILVWTETLQLGERLRGLIDDQYEARASNVINTFLAAMLGAVAYLFGTGIAEGMKTADKGGQPPAA